MARYLTRIDVVETTIPTNLEGNWEDETRILTNSQKVFRLSLVFIDEDDPNDSHSDMYLGENNKNAFDYWSTVDYNTAYKKAVDLMAEANKKRIDNSANFSKTVSSVYSDFLSNLGGINGYNY